MVHKEIGKISADEVFAKLSVKERNVVFLRGNSTNGWTPTIAWRPIAILHKASRRGDIEEFLAEQSKKERLVVGFVSYDFGARLHGLKLMANNDLKLPDVYLMSYENYVTFSDNRMYAHYLNQSFPKQLQEILKRQKKAKTSAAKITFKTNMSKSAYARAFNKIQEYITDGDIYQINFSHRLDADTNDNSRAIFTHLQQANPVDFAAYIEADDFQILSLSPERFVNIIGKKIVTSPIKGTAPRSTNSQVDTLNKNALLKSAKETAELNMITDLLRNDLGRVCTVGSVRVTKQRQLQANRGVWHTQSTVEGCLPQETSSVAAVLSMLPGGSISGVPKKRALEIIDELEPTRRGVYCGIIGRFEPNGDVDTSIAIRTMIKTGYKLYLQVGGGMVADSKLESEYAETFAKASALTDALATNWNYDERR